MVQYSLHTVKETQERADFWGLDSHSRAEQPQ